MELVAYARFFLVLSTNRRQVALKLQVMKIVPGLGMVAKLAYDLHRRAHVMAY